MSESLRALLAMPAHLPPTPIAPNRKRSFGDLSSADVMNGKVEDARIPAVVPNADWLRN
jgi:hypothetical protein